MINIESEAFGIHPQQLILPQDVVTCFPHILIYHNPLEDGNCKLQEMLWKQFCHHDNKIITQNAHI